MAYKLKVKKQKHVNTNHKKGEVAILTPDKVDKMRKPLLQINGKLLQ